MKVFYVLETTKEYYTIHRFDYENNAKNYVNHNKHRYESLELVSASHHLVVYSIHNYGDRFPVSIIREYYDRRWN